MVLKFLGTSIFLDEFVRIYQGKAKTLNTRPIEGPNVNFAQLSQTLLD